MYEIIKELEFRNLLRNVDGKKIWIGVKVLLWFCLFLFSFSFVFMFGFFFWIIVIDVYFVMCRIYIVLLVVVFNVIFFICI